MRLDIHRLEKRFNVARREFFRRARVVLERGLQLVERFEDKPSLAEGSIRMRAKAAKPLAKKPRKNFDKDLVKSGAVASQTALLGTHKIHRRTSRHH
jgi:hypothetical protein